MRIISGLCKGRRLSNLKGKDIRPTSDRVRESIFNIIGSDIKGARVLDMFAGTGALGIESLSRGAVHSVFIDSSGDACRLIKKNCEMCHMMDKSTVIQYDLLKGTFPLKVMERNFDMIFMDPPYERGVPAKILVIPDLNNCLAPGGRIILEHSIKEKIPENLSDLDIYDQRKYGKTLITFFNQKISKE